MLKLNWKYWKSWDLYKNLEHLTWSGELSRNSNILRNIVFTDFSRNQRHWWLHSCCRTLKTTFLKYKRLIWWHNLIIFNIVPNSQAPPLVSCLHWILTMEFTHLPCIMRTSCTLIRGRQLFWMVWYEICTYVHTKYKTWIHVQFLFNEITTLSCLYFLHDLSNDDILCILKMTSSVCTWYFDSLIQGMGGQMDYFGLWIDSSFNHGHSKAKPKCTTYGSPQLSAEPEFEVDIIEVWGLGPEKKEEGDSDEEKEKNVSSWLDQIRWKPKKICSSMIKIIIMYDSKCRMCIYQGHTHMF